MTLWRCRRRTESRVYSDCGLGSGPSGARLASGGLAAGPRGRSGGGEGGKLMPERRRVARVLEGFPQGRVRAPPQAALEGERMGGYRLGGL